MSQASQFKQSLLRYIRTMGIFLIMWHFISLVIDNNVLLPPPLLVISDFVDLLLSGEIFNHIVASMWRAVIAYVIAAAVGIPIGFLMGLNPLAKDIFDPIIEMVRPISGIAWIPLALFIFGVGNILPVFIIFYVAFFPFVLNTVGGVISTDPILINAARTMGVKRRVIILHVILPNTLPWTLTGARLGASGAWMALIAAEFIGATDGLGFAIQWFGGLLRTSEMLAIIATVALLGYCTDSLLRRLKRRLTRWSEEVSVG